MTVDYGSVELVRCFKFLEVLVNDTLTWLNHINMVLPMFPATSTSTCFTVGHRDLKKDFRRHKRRGGKLGKSLTDNSMSGKRTNEAIGSQHQNGMFCTTVPTYILLDG